MSVRESPIQLCSMCKVIGILPIQDFGAQHTLNCVRLPAGWDVRGGVTRLWAGERDLDELIANKDLGSQIALQTTLNFARKFEDDFGKKETKS